MSFAQLTYRESLRDIEACLRAQQNKLYHMGIRSDVSKSTLAYSNEGHILITNECPSLRLFELEIDRLEEELEATRKKAKQKFIKK